jgi:hypothetical protein
VLEEGSTICDFCKFHNLECIFAQIPRPAVGEIEQGNEALRSSPKVVFVRGFPTSSRHIGVLKCHLCRRENQKVGNSDVCERLGDCLTNSYSVLLLNASGT